MLVVILVNGRGYITTSAESYHIDSIEKRLNGPHFVFCESDFIGRNMTCGTSIY